MATEAKTPPAKPEPTLAAVSEVLKSPDKADAQQAGLVEGKTALLTSAVGRLLHPFQGDLEFNIGVVTPVKVDRWVVIQFEAGKLKRVETEST